MTNRSLVSVFDFIAIGLTRASGFCYFVLVPRHQLFTATASTRTLTKSLTRFTSSGDFAVLRDLVHHRAATTTASAYCATRRAWFGLEMPKPTAIAGKVAQTSQT